MFGISLPELLIILTIALIVFGPEKLPEVARNLGDMMGKLKRTSDGLRREFYNSIYTPAEDLKRRIDLEARELSPMRELTEIGRELREEFKPDPLCPDTLRMEEEKKRRELEEAAKKSETPPTKETPGGK